MNANSKKITTDHKRPQVNKDTVLKTLAGIARKGHEIVNDIRRPDTPHQGAQKAHPEGQGSTRLKQPIRSQERKVPLGPHLQSGKRADRTFALTSANDSEPIGVVNNSTHEFGLPKLEYDTTSKKLGNLNITNVRGTEYLGTVKQIGTSSKVALFSQLVNPVYVEGSRIATIAKMYTRWRPRSVEFHFAPSVPSTSGGSYAMAIIPDSAEPFLEVGEALARKVMSIDHALICNQFTPGHTRFTWPGDSEWSYVNGESEDDRFAAQAQFIMMQMSNSTLAANSALGELFVTYDYDFTGTQAPSTSTGFSSDITWSHAFTAGDLYGFLAGDISSGALDTDLRYTAIVVSSTGVTNVEWQQGESPVSAAVAPGMIMYLTHASNWRVFPVDTAPWAQANQLVCLSTVTPTVVMRVIAIGSNV